MPIPLAAACDAVRPASSSAIWAQARASWEKRSRRRAFFGGMKSSGSKSTAAAILLEKHEASKRVIAWTAETPRRTPSQRPSTPLPIGVIGPSPVIATRRRALTILAPSPIPPRRWP